jgi:hypothetical protein
MKYSALKNRYVTIEKELVITAGPNGSVLIPDSNTKLFLHWLNENGKMVATYTLTFPTMVHDTLKLINSSSNSVRVHMIDL